MSDFYATPTKVEHAKKAHKCSWCGEAIEVGSLYWRWFAVQDYADTLKFHPECYEVLPQGEEWKPYEHKRGKAYGDDD
jgi:hypothetical protein